MKKKISIILVLVLIIASLSQAVIFNTVHAKSEKLTLNKKVQVIVGKTKTVKLKNAPKKVKWKVANKKVVKIVKNQARIKIRLQLKEKKPVRLK